MNVIASLDNLVSWFIQVSILAFAAVLLPMLLRIRHPKSQLVYYHIVLLMCFAIPFIQPWQYPILLVSSSVATTSASSIPWTLIIMGLVMVGVAFRLGWLGMGLWQLRRYRRSAIPMFPVPPSVQDARRLTGADALFCVSKDVTGPATLGYIDPVVLLPSSFLSFDEEEQRSIACHELVHVRRKDWLVTILEEVTGALFWFNPAVRWLLSQAKLTREQVVDAEVVCLTGPRPYVQALLSMAVVTGGRWTVPAAPFFTEGHLMCRMRALLAKPNRSLGRLCISYFSTAFLLMVAGWIVMMWFPFTGEVQVVTTNRPIAPFMIPIPPQASGHFFSVRVPAPRRFVGSSARAPQAITIPAPQSGPQHEVGQWGLVMLPPPPLPPPPAPGGGSPGFFGTMGVRLIRPGERPSPEDLERFIQSFPERSVVQVLKAEDGTIQRITIQSRRLADAANSIPFVDPARHGEQLPSGTTNTAEPAVSTDGVD
jgi:hypothetical protein